MDYNEYISDFNELILFTPGPTHIRRELRDAVAAMPQCAHRDTEMMKRMQSIVSNLKEIAGVNDDYSILLIPGSGSNVMESSIVSLIGENDKILFLSNGYFGDFYHNLAVCNRKRADVLSFRRGSTIDLDVLDDHLNKMARNNDKPAAVAFTHNETSTGVMADVEAVSKVIKKYGIMVFVDGISIFGGAETGIQSNVDLYCAATQKCLALDAGFGIGIVAKEALSRAKFLKEQGKCSPPYLFDLTRHHEYARQSMTLTTPNCSLINGLYLQTKYIVRKEGIERRFTRHREMMEMTHRWVRELGNRFDLFCRKECASVSLTAVQPPPEYTIAYCETILEHMKREGYLFSTGIPPINKELERNGKGIMIRIPHMGDISKEMLRTYLESLRRYLL